MNKSQVKNIINSLLINGTNNNVIIKLLGKLDMMSEIEVEDFTSKFETETSLKEFLKDKIKQNVEERTTDHLPINRMFTYGIKNNCVHLHLPGNLRPMMSKLGPSKTLDTVNLYLLDAINKIGNMKTTEYPGFKSIDSIYMISPALIQRELDFLKNIDFKITLFSKKDLQDKNFVTTHPSARVSCRNLWKQIKCWRSYN